VALGAPCFFDGGGDSSGVAVGDRISNGEIDPVGVSNGSGVGEVFFFRCGEALGETMGEVFFFGLGDGDSTSSSVAELLFFFGNGVTDGVGDSLSRAGDDFFDGLGVGDFFFVADALFFFRGFGVGVGVERIFLMASPNDCSARMGASNESRIEMTMQRRIDMKTIGRSGATIS
jgi:hypothetical protein